MRRPFLYSSAPRAQAAWRTRWSRSATSLARPDGDWRGVRAAVAHPGGSPCAAAVEG